MTHEKPQSPFERYSFQPGDPLPVVVEMGPWRPLLKGEKADPLYIKEIQEQKSVPVRLYGSGKKSDNA